MGELLPVGGGLVVGLLLGSTAVRRRRRLGVLLAAVLGVLATVVTGDREVSWAFLLVNVPLALLAVAVGSRLARFATLWAVVGRAAHPRNPYRRH